VIVGVDARDRPGLLLDISKGLLRLNLTLRHSEASVVGDRSISIWRCEVIEAELPDLEEIWSVMNALLDSFDQGSSQAVKRGGLRVIRAVVTATSSLNGNNINDSNFREKYKAAIVAIQKGGRNVPLDGVVFGSGDVLVLKANDDSPLLKPPPPDFYKRGGNDGATGGNLSKSGSVNSFLKKVKQSMGTLNNKNSNNNNNTIDGETKESRQNDANAVPDLEVARMNDDDDERINFNNTSADDGDIFYIGESDEFAIDENDGFFPDKSENEVVIGGNIQASMNAIVEEEEIWKDLQVLFVDKDKQRSDDGAREFLTAMEVSGKNMVGRTVAEIGLDKLPGVFLVSIDRPTGETRTTTRPVTTTIMKGFRGIIASDAHSVEQNDHVSEVSSLPTVNPIFKTIPPDLPLQLGDVLWYSGGAQSVG
jgi:uncharacterized protein with PhoU and TrkA domain